MSTEENRLDILISKANQLVEKYLVLKDELKSLAFEKDKLLSQKQKAEDKIKELEEQLYIVKTTKEISVKSTSQDKDYLKSKLDTFIKDIDRCIAVLDK